MAPTIAIGPTAQLIQYSDSITPVSIEVSDAGWEDELAVDTFYSANGDPLTGVVIVVAGKGTYRTSLVHREYEGGGGTRIDVVVLSPADVAQIDSANLTNRGKYLLPAYAFEIGTEKTSDTRRHLESDLKKLATRSQGTGCAIHIFRDTTRSVSGTESRGRTDARLERDFKDVVARGA